MLKPICFPCQRFFRMKQAGFYFTEGMPVAGCGRPQPGTAAPQDWQPYKVWSGDLWECEGCGAKIIAGTGMSPVTVQHEKDFNEKRHYTRAYEYQVNDC